MSRKVKTSVLVVVILLACLLVFRLFVSKGYHADASNDLQKQFLPNSRFSGQIAVSIIERKTGLEQNIEFLIDLDRGDIAAAADGHQFQGRAELGGHLDEPACETMTRIPAPAGDKFAYCSRQGDSYSTWMQKSSAATAEYEWRANKDWAVRGLTWSPDSSALAVLLESERTDWSLIGLEAMASGHPIPLKTYKVVVLSAQPPAQLDLPVLRRDAPSGWARLDWINHRGAQKPPSA